MPKYKNIHPFGDVELVFHQQDDENGKLISRGRAVVLAAGEVFEVTASEEPQIADQAVNYKKVKEAGE